MSWAALGKPLGRAPAEEGGHVFLLRVFANMNMEMENSPKENTDPLFVLKPSRWRVGGYSFLPLRKISSEFFWVSGKCQYPENPPDGQLHLRVACYSRAGFA